MSEAANHRSKPPYERRNDAGEILNDSLNPRRDVTRSNDTKALLCQESVFGLDGRYKLAVKKTLLGLLFQYDFLPFQELQFDTKPSFFLGDFFVCCLQRFPGIFFAPNKY